MQLYVSKGHVDDSLVESVALPTRDAGAFGVCRAVLATMFAADRLDTLLHQMRQNAERKIPMLVLWGEQDPWMPATTPDRIQRHYGEDGVQVVRLAQGGHCPQDDASAGEVTAQVLKFVDEVHRG